MNIKNSVRSRTVQCSLRDSNDDKSNVGVKSANGLF